MSGNEPTVTSTGGKVKEELSKCQMQRPLSSYPLPTSHLAKLSSAGFETYEDLNDVGVVELSKELNVSPSEALEIIRLVTGKSADGSNTQEHPSGTKNNHPLPSGGIASGGHSALELLKVEQLKGYVVTFCAKVDAMLGGGIPVGKVTELCGAPGIGKTQFCMQLAVDVRMPEVFGGIDGEAIYIDTEGSFIVERVADIAAAAVDHLTSIAAENETQEAARQFTLEYILSGIHYFRCHDYLELVALVNILPEFLKEHSKVRLVVVDSIASHFRHNFEDMGLRNRVLSGLAQNLIRMATQSNIAVVLTNQMTTKFTLRGSSKSAQLVPALGESWGHASTIRVILFWNGSERYASLYKSPNRKETTVAYQITQNGVRDVDTLLNSQDPSALDPSSQLVSLSSSQVEDMMQSQGTAAELAELDQSLNNGSSTTDFVSVSEMHHYHSEEGTSGGVASGRRKRPHPDDLV